MINTISISILYAEYLLNIENDTIQFTIKNQTFLHISLIFKGKTISYAT